MLHKNVSVGDNHYIQNWEPADETARLALSVTSEDVGKVARQIDTNKFYILLDDTPMTWGLMTDDGGISYTTVQEDGVSLTQRTTINFIGNVITAVDNTVDETTDVSVANIIEYFADNVTEPTTDEINNGFVLSADGDWVEAAAVGIPQDAESAGFTLDLTQANKHIYYTGAAATITIPTNASVAFASGTVITIVNAGSGDVTIGTTGITLKQAGTTNTGNRTLAVDGLATIIKVATDTWYISGAGLS